MSVKQILYDRRSRNCLEDLLVSVAAGIGRRHELLYTRSWRFLFDCPDAESLVRLGSGLDGGIGGIGDPEVRRLVGQFHGLETALHQPDENELVDLAADSLGRGTPLILKRTAMREGQTPFLLLVGLVGDCFLFLDYDVARSSGSSCSRGSEKLPKLSEWLGAAIDLRLTAPEKLTRSVACDVIARGSVASVNTGVPTPFARMIEFADKVADGVDLDAETRGYSDQFNVPLFYELMRLSQGRYQFAEVMSYLAHGLTIPGFADSAKDLKHLGQEWNLVRSLLIKASLTSRPSRILRRIAARIEQLGEAERVASDRLHDRCQGKLDGATSTRRPPPTDLNRRQRVDKDKAKAGAAVTLLAAPSAAPSSVAILSRVWEEVLGVPVSQRVDFFESGGDSFAAVEIAAKAALAGYQLTPRMIYANPTIEQLARAAGPLPRPGIEPSVGEEIPLLPIQAQLFDLRDRYGVSPNPDHRTMDYLFDLVPTPELERVEAAVGELITQHAMLQARFSWNGERWVQRLAGSEQAPVSHYDLSRMPVSAVPDAFEALVAESRRSLSLADGPMFRFVLFRMRVGTPDRLLVTIHHLIADAVSMEVLFADFRAAYAAALDRRGRRHLGQTTPVSSYATRLAAHARSDLVRSEAEYWLNLPWRAVEPLPMDYPEGDSPVYAWQNLNVELETETAAALTAIGGGGDFRPHDLILVGLVQTIAEWTGGKAVAVHLSNHGRDPLFAECNLSRTVGCLVFDFPGVFHLPSKPGRREVLDSMSRQLRRIPHGGIGFGLLRYLQPGEELRQRFRALPFPDVSLYYLARMPGSAGRQGVPSTTTTAEDGPSLSMDANAVALGPMFNPAAQRETKLSIRVANRGRLVCFDFGYSPHQFKSSSIERVSKMFTRHLSQTIEARG